MRVKDVMSHDVQLARPDQPIKDVARIMGEIDAGIVPIAEGDRLVGMVTDRDIAVRAVAMDLPASTKARDIMSTEVKYCFEDTPIEDVARNMADLQVRRLPVVNRDKRLVGIISLGDIAAQHEEEIAGEAICGISEPGGQHSQRLNA